MADKFLDLAVDPRPIQKVISVGLDGQKPALDSTGAPYTNPGALNSSTDSVTAVATLATVPQSTGAANLATAQLAPTNVAATAVVARPTRTSVTLVNTGTVNVYFGPATVTTANGVLLAPGASRTFSWVGLLQMITSSGTGAVDASDEYN